MNILQNFLTKAASVTYQDLAKEYADKWQDDDAMEEMAGKAHAIAHKSGKDITQEEAELLMALMGKKDYDMAENWTNTPAGKLTKGLGTGAGAGLGGLLGGLLGGTAGAGIGHLADLSSDNKKKLTIGGSLGGLLAGLLAGGFGAANIMPSVLNSTKEDTKSTLKDDAENWADYVNKYREQGHPGMILP